MKANIPGNDDHNNSILQFPVCKVGKQIYAIAVVIISPTGNILYTTENINPLSYFG